MNGMEVKTEKKKEMTKMRGVQREAAGYFTVEASLIVPTVVVVIMLLMELSFYLYQACVYNQSAYIAALRGALYSGSNKEKYEYTVKMLHELSEEQLVSGGEEKVKISVGMLKTEVEIDFGRKFLLPGQGAAEPGRKEEQHMKIKQRAWIRNPVTYIRERRRLAET